MRAGRTEEASALARRVRTVIARQNSSWLRKVNTRKSPRDAWAKVREVIVRNRGRDHTDVEGITAQMLNDIIMPPFRQTSTTKRRHQS